MRISDSVLRRLQSRGCLISVSTSLCGVLSDAVYELSDVASRSGHNCLVAQSAFWRSLMSMRGTLIGCFGGSPISRGACLLLNVPNMVDQSIIHFRLQPDRNLSIRTDCMEIHLFSAPSSEWLQVVFLCCFTYSFLAWIMSLRSSWACLHDTSSLRRLWCRACMRKRASAAHFIRLSRGHRLLAFYGSGERGTPQDALLSFFVPYIFKGAPPLAHSGKHLFSSPGVGEFAGVKSIFPSKAHVRNFRRIHGQHTVSSPAILIALGIWESVVFCVEQCSSGSCRAVMLAAYACK